MDKKWSSGMMWIKKNYALIGLVLMATFLRFIPLTAYEFSHDELSALSRLVFPDLKQTLVFGVQYTDTHPALIQVFLYFWTKLFGISEIAVKLPFLLCGIAVVCLAYRFAEKWFGYSSALLVSVFFSASFIFLVYSSYARMYIPGVLFSIGCLHFLFHLIYDQNIKFITYLYFGVFCLLCGFNNHLNMLFAFTCAVSGLFLIPKNRLTPYLLTCASTLICYLPHLPITLTQLQMGGLGAKEGGWLPPPKPTILLDFIKTLLGTGFAGIVNIVMLGGIVLFSIFKKQKTNSKQWLLLGLFASNYLIIHAYSIYKSPVLQFSVLLFSGVCLLFFFTSFAKQVPKKIIEICCALILCSLTVQSVFNKSWFGNFQVHAFDHMTTESFRLIKSYGQEDVSSIYFSENYFIVYYLLKRHQPLNYVLATDSSITGISNFRNYLSHLTSNHLVLGYPDPLHIALAKEYFPFVEYQAEGYFYHTITLSKTNPKRAVPPVYKLASYDLLNSPSPFSLETSLKHQASSYLLDSTSGEFPLAFASPFKSLKVREGEWLLVTVGFEEMDSLHLSKEDLLCVSIQTTDSTKNYFNASPFSEFHTSKRTNTLYLPIFIGSDWNVWNQSGLLKVFVWKKDTSPYHLARFDLTHLDYNPRRWTLWQ